LTLMDRTADAAVHLERARRCWMKLQNDERLLQPMNNLRVLYSLQGDFDQAEGVLSQGLQKATSVTNPRPEVYLLHSSGDVQRDKGEYAAALETYHRALETARMMDDAVITIHISDAIANTYRLTSARSEGGR